MRMKKWPCDSPHQSITDEDLLPPQGQGLLRVPLSGSQGSNEREGPGEQHHEGSKQQPDGKERQRHDRNLGRQTEFIPEALSPGNLSSGILVRKLPRSPIWTRPGQGAVVSQTAGGGWGAAAMSHPGSQAPCCPTFSLCPKGAPEVGLRNGVGHSLLEPTALCRKPMPTGSPKLKPYMTRGHFHGTKLPSVKCQACRYGAGKTRPQEDQGMRWLSRPRRSQGGSPAENVPPWVWLG